ncbi:MAG: pyridoxal-phosphate dependent enzyme [Pseudomonadota bacterium]
MSKNTPRGYSYLNQRFPTLAQKLARLPLADLPTPLERLESDGSLWVKRDDLTHRVYGGNKVRKLEYLLADARQRGKENVVTFGGVGSNHALATALHATRNDLACTAMLMPQRMTDFVRGTLTRHQSNGTALTQYYFDREKRVASLRHLRDTSKLAVVPMGGTSPLGSIGYVNAAFEIAEQWPAGSPPPERIYLACGTMCTAAGLAVGMAMLGWPTQIIAVRVIDVDECNERAIKTLCQKIWRRLKLADTTLPDIDDPAANVQIRHDYLGAGYADPTPAAKAAVTDAASRWRLSLESTYTGKAMACLTDEWPDKATDSRWVFWQTYSGNPTRTLTNKTLTGDYADFFSLCS